VKVKQEAQTMSSLAEVSDVASAVGYIGKRLNTQSYHARKYIISACWVFPTWVPFSQWCTEVLGGYPPREMLVRLAKMSEEGNTGFGSYLWEIKRAKRT
jgi:hypothetical protein